MTDVQSIVQAPGVGARRKGPKSLPKLPLSVFTPPNSGTSDKFPLPPSPSKLHPTKVVDAHVSSRDATLSQWRNETENMVGEKSAGVVVSLQGISREDLEKQVNELRSASISVPILSIAVPYALEKGALGDLPLFLSSAAKVPVNLLTTFEGPSPKQAEGVYSALQRGYVVEVEVQSDLENEAGWEALEEFVEKSLGPPEQRKGSLVISGLLPPSHSLSIPIVNLLTHPIYTTYQARIATLSLSYNTYVKLLPPAWNAPTPSAAAPSDSQAHKDAKEWKRRIRMYLGPVLDAFGSQRIMYGSSPWGRSTTPSNAGDWYKLAREAIAEMGLEQEDIDAMFGNNAKTVYNP